MTLTVLISCMHQDNHDIIKKSNVQTDVVVVNQCDRNLVESFDFVNKKGETCHAKFINTTERGLSRSRNMAIANAEDADVCLICDDDEYLFDDYPQKILDSYKEEPEADIIAFSLDRKDHPKVFPNKKFKLGFKSIGQISSLQISFRRNRIVNTDINFDVKMGSGSGNGGGEENMFLHTCRRKGLKMMYFPKVIATILSTGNSKWFKGYTNEYFRNLGWVTRRIHGTFVGALYLFMWFLKHRKMYKSDNTTLNAVKNVCIGFNENR